LLVAGAAGAAEAVGTLVHLPETEGILPREVQFLEPRLPGNRLQNRFEAVPTWVVPWDLALLLVVEVGR